MVLLLLAGAAALGGLAGFGIGYWAGGRWYYPPYPPYPAYGYQPYYAPPVYPSYYYGQSYTWNPWTRWY